MTSSTVISIIQQRPKADQVAHYEAWLGSAVPIAQGFAGHQGVNVIRPHQPAGVYTIVLHFDTLEHLRGWLESNVRASLIEKARPMLEVEERIDIRTGLEFWFTPPPYHPPKPFKQLMVTLLAMFPLTVAVPWVLHPLLSRLFEPGWPVLDRLLVAIVIVGLMTYVVMPHLTRHLANWLYR
jgi:antibiotic biosynthesis monooxygenase (ABM) superfamily enzyme